MALVSYKVAGLLVAMLVVMAVDTVAMDAEEELVEDGLAVE